MNTYPLALIRRVSEFVTTIYGPAVTFAFPDTKVEAYRRWVLHLNLIPEVEKSTLKWCEQIVLCETMSVEFLFAKTAEPDMTAVNFNSHFCDRMDKMDRGQIKVQPKLWNLRPYDRMKGEITRTFCPIASYQKVKKKKNGAILQKKYQRKNTVSL